MKEKKMKLNKFANLLVIGLVLTVAASGCRKKPVNVTELPGARAGRMSDMPPGNPIRTGDQPLTEGNPIGVPTGHESNSRTLHDGWPEDAQTLKTETVYFDFDSSVLKGSEKPKVSAVADYLKANSANAVRVEGNCDERGTEEYNRSLGERRALAVREELIRSATAKISPQSRATMKPPGSKTAGTTSSFCRRPSNPVTVSRFQ
jgi:outer membrane protein OmpA-like peptidoglycan-associated protein